jgi:putative endopeptidase
MQRMYSKLLGRVLPAPVMRSPRAPVLREEIAQHGIDPMNLDFRVDPRADFYRFANGGWLDRTPIPLDRGRYGVFEELRDRTREQLLNLLSGLTSSSALREGSDEWKAVEFFKQGIDVATRNAQGVDPIRPILDAINGIDDLPSLHTFQQHALTFYVTGLFQPWIPSVKEGVPTNAVYLYGPFLGMYNRDYYLVDNEANQQVRARYVATCARLLAHIGYDQARAQKAAQAVYDLERAFAKMTFTSRERQGRAQQYTPASIADLSTQYPPMDWTTYFQIVGLADIERIIVTQPRYLSALPDIVNQTSLETLKDYYKLEVLWSFAPTLSEEIETTAFEFRGKVLRGREDQEPVEERVLSLLNAFLGEALGKLYVAEYFPPEAKTRITELVDALKLSFRYRLESCPWLASDSKVRALEKLDRLGIKVGYPDHWRSYEAVSIEASFAMSFLGAFRAEARRVLNQAGKPIDRDQWFVPPQEVNAFYISENNEIIFPAAILQLPYFDHRADMAFNFGAIGSVIGHEMTHAFDLDGATFDAEGNLNDWPTMADYERFQQLKHRVMAQYNALEVRPGLFVNGRLAINEIIADLGGVQLAYDALRRCRGTRTWPWRWRTTRAAAAPRLTDEQRFFVAWASCAREVFHDETLAMAVQTDPHLPGSVRGSQPLRNMGAFIAAFDIRRGDPMYLSPKERVAVW